VLESSQVRYREPYNNARHSYISWCLMIGKNILLVAKEDGHSAQTMLSTLATWIEGAKKQTPGRSSASWKADRMP